MKTHPGKVVQWLHEELPSWTRDGLIDDAAAARLRERYPIPPSRRADMVLLAFGILGSAAIGAGLILLLAHNWDDLSRPMRVALSFLPLVASQGLAGYVLARKSESVAWREATAVFATLAIGVCIALVSQTYQYQGTLEGFLFIWLLLGAAVPYLLDSKAAAVLYLAGLTLWCFSAHDTGIEWFWLLAGMIAPYLWHGIGRSSQTGSAALLAYAMIISLTITGYVLSYRGLDGAPIVVYAGLMAALTLYGALNPGAGGLPFARAGGIGSVCLALVLTFEDPWRFHHHLQSVSVMTETHQFAMLAVTQAIALWLLTQSVRRGNMMAALWGALAPLALACYLASHAEAPASALQAVFNAYIFALGIFKLLDARRRMNQLGANIGLAILSLLLVARFMDSGVSSLTRGVAFIAIGVAFLIANIYYARLAHAQQGDVPCSKS